ncbi:MAG: DeoR/GlpR family DNA-binding transcription regulator [Lentisphaerales bacterium]|nr:DeoR/GlpR family DNA-binding transcription regulator [Lentisphaerales bacterium]
MNRIERQLKIRQEVNSKGRVKAINLVERFGVTPETIRRDLNEMEKEGLLEKIHGGAVSLVPVENILSERFDENSAEKKDIAQKVTGLIKPAQHILIDFGSTTLAVAEELHKIDDLTIYTNSHVIVQAIAAGGNPTQSIHMLGGHYLPKLRANHGYETINSINKIMADVAIVGIAAVNEDHGLMVVNPDEAAVAESMLDNAKTKIIVGDSSKYFKLGPHKIARMVDVDYFVGSDKENDAMNRLCEKSKVEYL